MLQHQINTDKKLVFAIVEHPMWGMIIEAYAVKMAGKNQFSYEVKKITRNNIKDFFDDTGELELRLLELLEKYSDENIHKRFGKHKERQLDFLKRTEKSFIEKHIRPYIEKHLSEITDILSASNTHLYYQGTPGSLVNERPVSIFKDRVEPVFNFERHDGETRYYLTLKTESQNIFLTNRNALILSNYPCLLLMDNKIYRFDENFDGKKLLPFLKKEYIVIPGKNERQYFETFVKRTVKKYKVKASGFEIQEIIGEPVPLLRLEADLNNRAVLAVSFKYGEDVFFSPSETDPCKVTLSADNDSYRFRKTVRDFEKERIYENILSGFGLEKLNPSNYILPGEKMVENHEEIIGQRYGLLDWLTENKELLSGKGFQFIQDYFREKYFIGKPAITLNADERSDWFDLRGYVLFGEHKVPFIALKNNILHGKREYLLPDGTTGLIPCEWFERFSDIMTFATKEDEKLTLNKHHFTILENLDLIKKHRNIKGVPFKREELPKLLTASLRPYQLTGFQWLNFLKNNKLGGCLADDMGLGKTVQVLAALLKLKEWEDDGSTFGYQYYKDTDNSHFDSFNPMQLDLFADGSGKAKRKNHTSLIIMPLSLIHNWVNEIRKFTPALKIFQHIGINRPQNVSNFSRYDLVLTTYGTVRSDIDMLKEYLFTYIILDESQVIKNAESKIFMAVKQLRGMHRLVLTGTPIENSLTDLWSQFSFLNPGMLGSLNSFKKEFVIPIEKQNDEHKRIKLQNLIQPFVLRRNKNKVAAELPDLTEKVHYCEMTEEQSSFYERKKSEARNMILENYRIAGSNKTKFLLLSSLMKLRLIANHPVIVENNYDSDSGKFREILHNVNKVLSEDHKVLLFSQFVKHLNIFADHFKKNDIPFGMLTGRVSEKERKPIIERFQNDADMRVFLISIRAGGVGLNLTGADYVFMLDPWWNPAVEAQAINRAHRIGQDKKVFVYKFITRATVEEKIMALQKHKSELSGMFINQNNPLKSMQMDELVTLL